MSEEEQKARKSSMKRPLFIRGWWLGTGEQVVLIRQWCLISCVKSVSSRGRGVLYHHIDIGWSVFYEHWCNHEDSPESVKKSKVGQESPAYGLAGHTEHTELTDGCFSFFSSLLFWEMCMQNIFISYKRWSYLIHHKSCGEFATTTSPPLSPSP